jgi:hypothetical protein
MAAIAAMLSGTAISGLDVVAGVVLVWLVFIMVFLIVIILFKDNHKLSLKQAQTTDIQHIANLLPPFAERKFRRF